MILRTDMVGDIKLVVVDSIRDLPPIFFDGRFGRWACPKEEAHGTAS